ncbi:MAG: D-glycero-beta-D-manno-heptose 1-phosphate adenylyltransferase [Bacillota bacterium]
MTGKILARKELIVKAGELKDTSCRIAFTNGCFDLLHVGHVRYLRLAAELADVLVVAVNSDSSAAEIKGPERPIIEEDDRIEIVAALEMVDYAVLFSETTCCQLLQDIKPEVYVKGGDYTKESLPEWPAVQEYGGEVEFINLVSGKSTSKIIDRIRKTQMNADRIGRGGKGNEQ